MVTSSGGFILRRVFYSVPSRLIGHRLNVHLYDDRLECFLGATQLLTLRRGRPPQGSGKHGHVVDYHHVIHALRKKADGAAQSGLSRSAVPAPAYVRAFEALLAKQTESKPAAQWSACLRSLMTAPARPNSRMRSTPILNAGCLPDLDRLRDRFKPDAAAIPCCRRACATLRLRRAGCCSCAEDRARARGRRGMKTINPVDAARIELLLADLRLPAIKLMWTQASPSNPTRKAGPQLASLPRSPSTRSPTAVAGASSVTLPKHDCPWAKRSTASTSTWCREQQFCLH